MSSRPDHHSTALDTGEALEALRYDAEGRVPVVAQDAETGAVLMVAWANLEALRRTLDTGFMHYWSRSRDQLWHKGATSGNVQELVSMHADCDGDTVLALVRPAGPACHTGADTCFGAGATVMDSPGRSSNIRAMDDLWQTLQERVDAPLEGSYTARLLADENLRIKKLGEEMAELILALSRGDDQGMAEEAADLFYHTLVALLGAGSSLYQVMEVLDRRRNRAQGHG